MKRLTRKVGKQVIFVHCYTECMKEPLTGRPCPHTDCAFLQHVCERLFLLENMIQRGELVRVDPEKIKKVGE